MSDISTNKPTILIVDDTPFNVQFLSQLLSREYRVKVAGDGASALAIATQAPHPDLILLDIMMPQMDGYEVLRKLRKDRRCRAIPIILITALTASEHEKKGFDLGASDYIVKPVKSAVLMARVQRQLETKKIHDELQKQNAKLHADLERRDLQNRIINGISLRALAYLSESRENATDNHIARMEGYVKILADELSKLPQYASIITPERIDSFVQAVSLHDIGKVAIPDAILCKPDHYTEQEREIMKTHSHVGSSAIRQALQGKYNAASLDFLDTALEMTSYHHEKWDGTGYPDGLSGTNIPLSARIMALADVFDALVSERSYKPAFSLENATRIILENRGTHFDPDIVDAFVKRADDFKALVQRYRDNMPLPCHSRTLSHRKRADSGLIN